MYKLNMLDERNLVMKKVGIMTFHRALNYGAVLQAYALQKTISSFNGVECEVVDYLSPKITSDYKPFRVDKNNLIKSISKSIIMYQRRKKRKNSFDLFLKDYINTSQKIYDENSIELAKNDYDMFITGSDQVWSPRCVGFDPIYFLTFAENAQKYSYAASFAVKSLPSDLEEEYKNRLKGFQTFSVRESSGKDLVRSLTGRDACVNIDPSLLLNASEWKKIATSVEKKHYILVFTANPQISLFEFAYKLSKEKGLPIYYISDTPCIKKNGITYIVAPTVNEFVGYFMDADYVVTNSFHGTAFSVIFNKDLFVEFKNKSGRNIRSESLLNLLGINREIVNGMCEETYINWNDVNKKLEQEVLKSLNYLKRIVE